MSGTNISKQKELPGKLHAPSVSTRLANSAKFRGQGQGCMGVFASLVFLTAHLPIRVVAWAPQLHTPSGVHLFLIFAQWSPTCTSVAYSSGCARVKFTYS